jgi:hypothetical protein
MTAAETSRSLLPDAGGGGRVACFAFGGAAIVPATGVSVSIAGTCDVMDSALSRLTTTIGRMSGLVLGRVITTSGSELDASPETLLEKLRRGCSPD